MPSKKTIATYQQKKLMEAVMVMNSTVLSTPSDRQWHTGWSFARVAEHHGLTADHARRLAKELEITIVAAPPPPTVEERIASIEMQIGLMQSALNQLDIVATSLVKEVLGVKDDGSQTEEWNQSFGDARSSEPQRISPPAAVRPERVHTSSAEPLSEVGGEGASKDGATSEPVPTRSLLKELEAGRRHSFPRAAAEGQQGAQGHATSNGKETSTG